MGRLTRILVPVIFLLMLPLFVTLAKQPGGGGPLPFGTSTPCGDDPNLPPFAQPGCQPDSNQPPFGQPGGPGGQPLPFSTLEQPTDIPTPTLSPTPTPDPGQQLMVVVRQDLELLVDAALSGRPDSWLGPSDIYDPNAPLNARIDLELLAGTLLGANTRPEGWFGVVPSTSYAVVRDIRHDLELLAQQVLGTRPVGWIGGAPIMQCDRSTQAIVQFLELNGVFTVQADRTAPDFCRQAAIEASTFVEINILNNPRADTSLVVPGLQLLGGNATINSDFAAAFYDRFANRRAGVVPNGTTIEAVGRSPGQFSNMMLIRGQGFEVFVDYQFTSVTNEQFEGLPTIDDASINPSCTLRWCRS